MWQPLGDREISELSRLEGALLRRAGRAASIGRLGFGDLLETQTPPGSRNRLVTAMAIHIQCAWRIASRSRVLLGSNDISLAPDAPTLAVGERGATGAGPSLFDRRAACITSMELMVVRVEVGWAGALLVELSGGHRIEVMPDDTLDEEMWRFLRPGCPHLVVGAAGAEWRR